MHRPGLAGGEGDVQHVAGLQQLLEEIHVGGHVDLTGLRQLALTDEAVETGQRRRVAAHIVVILRAVHHVGVEQHRDMAAGHIRIGQIHSGAAAERELVFHSVLLILYSTMKHGAVHYYTGLTVFVNILFSRIAKRAALRYNQ